jgi:hypothetical protein
LDLLLKAAPIRLADYTFEAVGASLIHPVFSHLGQACLDRLGFMRPPPGPRLWLGPEPNGVGLALESAWEHRSPALEMPNEWADCLGPSKHGSYAVVVDTATWQVNGLSKDWFAQVCQCLLEGGVYLFAGLGPSSLRGLRQRAVQQGGALGSALESRLARYRMDLLPDMHDLGDQLQQAGLSSPVMESDPLTFSYQTPRQLIKDLRAWPLRFASAASNRQAAPRAGAGPGLESSGWGLQESPLDEASWLGAQAFRAGFQALERAQDHGVLVDWELVIGHAWRPVPKPKILPEAEKLGFSPLRFFRKKP